MVFKKHHNLKKDTLEESIDLSAVSGRTAGVLQQHEQAEMLCSPQDISAQCPC